MKRVDLERFPTDETALRMMARVSPIYEKSYVGKWLFQVMGAEMGEARALYEELRLQAWPETATWGIAYWEQRYGITPSPGDDLEARRQAVIYRRDIRSPMNPARVELIIGNLTQKEVHAEENVAPYTFRVTIMDEDARSVDTRQVLAQLRKIKPSHQDFELCLKRSAVFENGPGAFVFHRIAVTGEFSSTRGGRVIVLDGSDRLDGTWQLDQTFSGAAFPHFSITADIPHTERLEGAVTVDTWYEMDGSVLLDGSRKLNARIEKEDI